FGQRILPVCLSCLQPDGVRGSDTWFAELQGPQPRVLARLEGARGEAPGVGVGGALVSRDYFGAYGWREPRFLRFCARRHADAVPGRAGPSGGRGVSTQKSR